MKPTRIVTQFAPMLATALLTAGCAATATQQNAPTHRWASSAAIDEVDYRNDHARCQAQASMGNSSTGYETNSEAFSAYKQCMVSRGYELTAYRD